MLDIEVATLNLKERSVCVLKMRLLGYRDVDFTPDGGSRLTGKSLYVAYPKKGVEGEMAKKYFVGEDFALPPVKPGDIIDVVFNDTGKPESITTVNK